jgi:choline dehydrogenase-like flavoprotein
MYLDATQADEGTRFQADVCIIGGGPAGIVLADRLSRSGSRVIVCEGGGMDFSEDSQALYAGETDGPVPFDVQSSRLRYFGGTSNHWGGQVGPFDPIDLRRRSWVPDSGWPIDSTDLTPYYDAAHIECEADGPAEFELTEQQKYQLAELEYSDHGIVNKLRRFSPPTRFAEKYRAPFGAKDEPRVLLHATVTGFVTTDGDQHVTAAIVRTPRETTLNVQAEHFIVACGGIENPRLLLQPTRRSPNGLGNGTGMVGRYFQFHPRTRGAAFILSPGEDERFRAYRSFVSQNGKIQLLWGFTDAYQEQNRLLNGCFLPRRIELSRLEEDYEPHVIRAVRSLLRLRPETAGDLSVLSLRLLVEQVPNPESRVVLTNNRDRLGALFPRVEWRLTDLDKSSYRRSCQLLAEAIAHTDFGRLGVPNFYALNEWTEATFSSYHHMGATRMGADPRNSVVDPDCRVHTVDNLYVAGSSVFPTSSWINPTYTILALALRLADHIKSRARG